MDPKIRLLTAAAVMLIGMGLALCFRRPPAEMMLTIPAHGDPLAMGESPAQASFAAAPPPTPLPRHLPAMLPATRQATTVVTPNDRPGPPPEFPERLFQDHAGTPKLTARDPGLEAASKGPAGGDQLATTRWGASMARMLPETAGASSGSPLTHKIVDGDTLPLLAERYLGSASRAMEIYEANRNVLADPNILRIGAELKIPGSAQARAQ